MPVKICEHCNKRFLRGKHQGAIKFCSEECRLVARRLRQRAYERRVKRPPHLYRVAVSVENAGQAGAVQGMQAGQGHGLGTGQAGAGFGDLAERMPAMGQDSQKGKAVRQGFDPKKGQTIGPKEGP